LHGIGALRAEGAIMAVIRLHVSGLSRDTREADLSNLFNRAGLVMSVSIPVNERTGRGQDFGFVNMGTEAGAQAAISSLDGTILRESQISVREAGSGE